MTQGPPLLNGEEVVFDHIPSLRVFKRAALILLLISLVPTAVFAAVFPDTYWVMLPMFLSCIVLLQERFKLGRHRAWITNQRLILQGGNAVDLASITDTKRRPVSVTVSYGPDGTVVPLFYPADAAALMTALSAPTTGDAQ